MPAGDVAIKNVADLYLYPNTVRAVLINGAQVKEWLEMSAGIFNQVTPGKADQPLLNDAFPSYNFDVIDGVTYRIDLSQPPKYDPKGGVINPNASRIVDLAYQGKPVTSDQQVRGRHQQLPGRRRRQLPRHQRQGDHLRRRRTPTAT